MPNQPEFNQKPEFCREPVAVLVAAIIASAIDPMDGPHDMYLQYHGPFDEETLKSQEIAAHLASLMTHFEARVDAMQAYGMPDHLANEYQKLKDLILETAQYQLAIASAGDEPLQ